MARTQTDDVVGTFVNEAGEPVEHVDGSFPGSAIENTDKEGKFRHSRKLNQSLAQQRATERWQHD